MARNYRQTYEPIARQAATQAGLDADFFVRLINQESGFNPAARSPVGAIGIAQIMPTTAKGWRVDPRDPVQALYVSARELGNYYTTYKRQGLDDTEAYRRAAAAYNAGPGAVAKAKGVPNYPETQNYVAAIMGGQRPTQGFAPQPKPSGFDPAAYAAQVLQNAEALRKTPKADPVRAFTQGALGGLSANVYAPKPVNRKEQPAASLGNLVGNVGGTLGAGFIGGIPGAAAFQAGSFANTEVNRQRDEIDAGQRQSVNVPSVLAQGAIGGLTAALPGTLASRGLIAKAGTGALLGAGANVAGPLVRQATEGQPLQFNQEVQDAALSGLGLGAAIGAVSHAPQMPRRIVEAPQPIALPGAPLSAAMPEAMPAPRPMGVNLPRFGQLTIDEALGNIPGETAPRYTGDQLTIGGRLLRQELQTPESLALPTVRPMEAPTILGPAGEPRRVIIEPDGRVVVDRRLEPMRPFVDNSGAPLELSRPINQLEMPLPKRRGRRGTKATESPTQPTALENVATRADLENARPDESSGIIRRPTEIQPVEQPRILTPEQARAENAALANPVAGIEANGVTSPEASLVPEQPLRSTSTDAQTSSQAKPSLQELSGVPNSDNVASKPEYTPLVERVQRAGFNSVEEARASVQEFARKRKAPTDPEAAKRFEAAKALSPAERALLNADIDEAGQATQALSDKAMTLEQALATSKQALKGGEKETVRLIDQAMKDGAAIDLSYRAEKVGATSGDYGRKREGVTPYSWSVNSQGELQFKAYNPDGHPSTYFIRQEFKNDGSPLTRPGSKVLDMPTLSRQPAFSGMEANVYKGPQKFNAAEVLALEERAKAIKDSTLKRQVQRLNIAFDELPTELQDKITQAPTPKNITEAINWLKRAPKEKLQKIAEAVDCA